MRTYKTPQEILKCNQSVESVLVKWPSLRHSSENLPPFSLNVTLIILQVGKEVNLNALLDVKRIFLWSREVTQEVGACEITDPKLT